MLSFIVAMSENGVIGAGGGIPWKVPGEQAYFKRVTMGHPVVMGRKTYEAIRRPLPGRPNYVMTRNKGYQARGCHVIHSVDDILALTRTDEVFVIGGAEVFDMLFPYVDRIYLTVIHRTFDGDTYFPPLEMDKWQLVKSYSGPSTVIPHTFQVYRNTMSK